MNTKLTVKIILIIIIIIIVNNINSTDNFTDINEFCSPEEIQKKYQSSDSSGVVRCHIDAIIHNYKDNITKLNEFINNVSSNDGLKLVNELKIKQLNPISSEQIANAFQHKNLTIYTDPIEFQEFLKTQNYSNTSLLLMSSGNYGGLNFDTLQNLMI